MKNKDVEVIRLLIENKAQELNINQIAKLLKKDYKNTHNIITRLAKMQILNLEQFGKSYRVLLLRKAYPLIYEAEYLRKRDLLKNKTLAVMHDAFNKLHSRLYVLLVFGSYAKKTQTKHSDVDLLFVVPDKEAESMEKAITNIASTLPLKIHINIFNETEFIAMKNSKEVTIGSEAIMNNVILQGIEQYYEMIR